MISTDPLRVAGELEKLKTAGNAALPHPEPWPRAIAMAAAAALCLAAAGCSPGAPPHAAAPAPAAQVGPIRLVDRAGAAGLNYTWRIAGGRPLNILQGIGNGCAFLDYDNDGCLDVLLVGPRLALFRGDGKGKFTDVTGGDGSEPLSGPVPRMRRRRLRQRLYPDIYISGYRTGILLHNEGGKHFTDVTARAGLKPQPGGLLRLGGDGAGQRTPGPVRRELRPVRAGAGYSAVVRSAWRHDHVRAAQLRSSQRGLLPQPGRRPICRCEPRD